MNATPPPREDKQHPHEQRSDASPFSMSLLMRLMANPLDADYEEAARRREGEAGPRRGWPVRVLLAAVLLCAGMFTAVAVSQAREQPIAGDQRDRLVGQIKERTRATDDLQHRLVSLRGEIARARAARLAKTTRGRGAREHLRRVELAAAVVPARGPGLAVTLDDPTPEDDGIPAQRRKKAKARVLDTDIQLLVNALWAAGAEAVAVDGQRVTSLTAVRSAGKAILVNYRPVNPPYVVTAIGDPDQLRSRFASSQAGRRFHTLHANLGIRFAVTQKSHIRVPGASGVSLRHASEPRGGDHPKGGSRGGREGDHEGGPE